MKEKKRTSCHTSIFRVLNYRYIHTYHRPDDLYIAIYCSEFFFKRYEASREEGSIVVCPSAKIDGPSDANSLFLFFLLRYLVARWMFRRPLRPLKSKELLFVPEVSSKKQILKKRRSKRGHGTRNHSI